MIHLIAFNRNVFSSIVFTIFLYIDYNMNGHCCNRTHHQTKQNVYNSNSKNKQMKGAKERLFNPKKKIKHMPNITFFLWIWYCCCCVAFIHGDMYFIYSIAFNFIYFVQNIFIGLLFLHLFVCFFNVYTKSTKKIFLSKWIVVILLYLLALYLCTVYFGFYFSLWTNNFCWYWMYTNLF